MSAQERSTITLDFGTPDDDVYNGPHSAVLFEGVMARRVVAHILDIVALVLIAAVLSIPFFIFGILTFGLLFIFYGAFLAAIVLTYITLSLGGESGATPGMRAMNIELRRLDGRRPTRSLAFLHALFFFALEAVISPLILLVGLFNRRGRLVHDFLCGTVMINNAERLDTLLGR
jgi:uncharacterized RDD family membrane protein YckC